MESIEASGKSVDDAVLQALAGLKRRRDEVDITVLQEPSRGTFGIGNKEARVRVTVRPNSTAAIITPQMADAILGPDEEEYLEEETPGEFDEEEYAGDEEEMYGEGEDFDAEEYEEEELEEEGQIPTFAPVGPGQ